MFSASVEPITYELTTDRLSLLAAIVFGVWAILRAKYKDTLETLGDDFDRQNLRSRLSKTTPIHIRYSLSLLQLNTYVSRIYAAPASAQALERCLIFSLIYPFILYIVGWTLGGSNKYGNLVFLGSQAEGIERLSVAAAYLATVVLSAASIASVPKSECLFVFSKTSVFPAYSLRDWAKLALCVAAFAGLWLVNQSLTSVGFAVSFAVYSLLSLAFYFAWRAAMTRQAASSPVIGMMLPLLLTILAISVRIFGLGAGTIAFVVLFFVAFPIVNAFFDYLSWYVTRWFLKIAEGLLPSRDSYLRLLRGLCVDVVWAVVCLLLLTIAIGAVLRLFDFWFPAHTTDWQAQLRAIRTGTGNSGLLVSGMLATTFMPTLVHIFIGTAGILIAFTPSADRAIALLSEPKLSMAGKQELARIIRSMQILTYTIPVIAAIVVCSFPALIATTVGPIASDIALKLLTTF